MNAISLCVVLAAWTILASAQPLPSWNEGEAKARIVTFVQAVTDRKSKDYVAPVERVAKAKGWIVVSMKSDWKKIFSFEK